MYHGHTMEQTPKLTPAIALLILAAAACPVTAATARDLPANELEEQLGDSLAKQVKEAENALQQAEDSKTRAEVGKPGVKQPAAKAPQAKEAPEPEEEPDEEEPDEEADESEEEGDSLEAEDDSSEVEGDSLEVEGDSLEDTGGEDAATDKPSPATRDGNTPDASKEQKTPEELRADVELLIKTKRTVDAKIERSRKEISNMRRKMARIDTNLRKRRERERKRYERDLAAARRNYNRNTHDIFGNYIEVRPMKDITLSAMDRNTIANSQQRIAQYKTALPQLIAFSQELTTNIDSSMKQLGSAKSAIINSYEADGPDTKGPETENDRYDTKSADSFGN